jgi:hypothetical protein
MDILYKHEHFDSNSILKDWFSMLPACMNVKSLILLVPAILQETLMSLGRLDTGIMGSNPAKGMDVFRVFLCFAVLWV